MEAETRDWRLGVKTAESSREVEASGRAGSGALGLRCGVLLTCRHLLRAKYKQK